MLGFILEASRMAANEETENDSRGANIICSTFRGSPNFQREVNKVGKTTRTTNLKKVISVGVYSVAIFEISSSLRFT